MAPAVINAKTCGNDGTDGTPIDGKTRVKIICVGDAADFGGEPGDTVDCFRPQGFNLDPSVCDPIKVTIRYKIINPSGEEDGTPDFPMKLDFATFGQGFSTNNFARSGAKPIDYGQLDPEPANGTVYPTAQGSTHNIQRFVNPCSNTDGNNNFFMKMKLKPTNNAINTTSKCGTNKFVNFNNGVEVGAGLDFAADAKPNNSGAAQVGAADAGTKAPKGSKSPKKSKAPAVKKSKAPAVKKSKAPAVKKSKAPAVKKSKAPSFSKAPKTSKAPAVKKTKAPSGKAGSRKM